MSKSRVRKNYDEASMLIEKYRMSEHLLAMAMVQLIEREKVRVLNKYRAEHGEELLSIDAPMFEADKKMEWLVDVPTSWISETGRGL